MESNLNKCKPSTGSIFGIITTLAALFALLFPVLGAARQSPNAKYCMDNVKMSGLSMLMYCEDYDERLPRAHGWMTDMSPYTKDDSAYRCPAAQTSRDSKVYGYAFDSRLSMVFKPFITYPAGDAAIYESTNLGLNATDPFKSVLDFKHKRHEGVIIGFIDGHVKQYEGENTIAAEILKLSKPPVIRKRAKK